MHERCPECNVVVAAGSVCRDLFHELLLLEAQAPDAPGSVTHFYTVACYALQHPESFQFTHEALVGLHQALCAALDGRVSLDELRTRAREGAARLGRVTLRYGDPPHNWKSVTWTITVADVLSSDPSRYHETVVRWAHSIRTSLAHQAVEVSSAGDKSCTNGSRK